MNIRMSWLAFAVALVVAGSAVAQTPSAEQDVIQLSRAKWQWMADKAVDKLEPLFHERDLRLRFADETQGKMPFIKVDPDMITQCVINLMSNAMRYTPDGGRITCRVAVLGDFITLEIEDSGIGITEEQSTLVFERFYRVDGTGVDGSGLGLAIVREIAELHRANASLRPNPQERGAIARVVFPRYRPRERIPEFDAQIEGEVGFRNPPTGFV